MQKSGLDLLYIHPHNNIVDDRMIPCGAITCVNFAPGKKLGVFSFDCTDEQILGSRIVAIDWHWYSGFPAVRALCERVRIINPRARIVVGGMTCSLLSKHVFELLPADFAAIGDAELALSSMVESANLDHAEGLVNVLSADGRPHTERDMTEEEFARLDPVTATWFPSLGKTDFVPSVFVARGCFSSCAGRCPSRNVFRPGSRVHTGDWIAGVVNRIAEEYGEDSSFIFYVFGGDFESRLFEMLDEIKTRRHLRPIFVPCGFNLNFVGHALDAFPHSTASLVSPWDIEALGLDPVSEEERVRRIGMLSDLFRRFGNRRRNRIHVHSYSGTSHHIYKLADDAGAPRSVALISDNYNTWSPETAGRKEKAAGDIVREIEPPCLAIAEGSLLEYLVPDIYALYPLRRDPHAGPSARPHREDLTAYHDSVLEGWHRWRIMAAARQRFLGFICRSDRSEQVGRASLDAISDGHFITPASEAFVQVDAHAITLHWREKVPTSISGCPEVAVGIVPALLLPSVKKGRWRVALFPVPRRQESAEVSLDLSLRWDGLRWRTAWERGEEIKGDVPRVIAGDEGTPAERGPSGNEPER